MGVRLAGRVMFCDREFFYFFYVMVECSNVDNDVAGQVRSALFTLVIDTRWHNAVIKAV